MIGPYGKRRQNHLILAVKALSMTTSYATMSSILYLWIRLVGKSLMRKYNLLIKQTVKSVTHFAEKAKVAPRYCSRALPLYRNETVVHYGIQQG